MLERVVSTSITTGAWLLTGVHPRWSGSAPSETQRIYFANHTSHMDFVLLWSALPARLRQRARPVAAREYWSRGAVRRYMIHRVFRGVVVDRIVDRLESPIAPMVDALDEGDSLILFPEGTRGPGGSELLPFKAGIFHVAKARPNVELVPVWMENSHRVMPKGAVLPIPLLCSVTFGAGIHLYSGEDKAAFLGRLRAALLGLRRES
ncbi:MAG: lysophospholipid acyltransferase family protein [Bryobacteraceae bacterium]